MSTKLEDLSEIDEQEYENDIRDENNQSQYESEMEEYTEDVEQPKNNQIAYSLYQNLKEPVLASLLVLILSNKSFLEIMAKIPYIKNIPSSIFAAVMMGILFFVIRIFI